MKVYKGVRLDNYSVRVTVNGKCLKHYVRHSPTGYEWGYGGSGPADLSRSILINYFDGDFDLADKYYYQFKYDFVCKWGSVWEVNSEEINKWLGSVK